MKTIKTAISVDKHVFHGVERLAKSLHISRSRFFTQAARHMIERDENLELWQKINAAYGYAGTHEEKSVLLKERSYAHRKAGDAW